MKKVFIILLIIFSVSKLLAQTQYQNALSSFGNNVSRINVLNGFQLPRATDTTLKNSLDTVGMMLYTIPDQTVWLRVLSSGVTNKWTKLTCDFTNYWQLTGNNLYPISASYDVGIGVVPTHKFHVLDNNATLYFDEGTLHLEDNPDSINILINSTATNGSNNVFVGNGIGQIGNNHYNTAVGNKVLKNGLNQNFNSGFGQAALLDAQTNNSAAFGIRASEFAQGDSLASFGATAGQESYGKGNTAIGSNAQTANIILRGTIKPAEIIQGTSTFVGVNTATFITAAGLSVGDTMIFFNSFKTAPNSQENPLNSRGIVTSSNTITFLNQSSFATGVYDTVSVTVYDKQNYSIALGMDAVTTNSHQFGISPQIDTIYTPGMASANGYVLTVDANNKATWQPSTGSVSGGNAASVTTIPALTSFVRDTVTTVFVTDTKRGGVVHYSASGTNDNGTIFPANGGGHWVRDMSQSDGVNVQWFGAKGDGTTDDRNAIQDAVDYFNGAAGTIYFPATSAYYRDTLPVYWASNLTLKMEDGAVIYNDRAVSGIQQFNFIPIAFGNYQPKSYDVNQLKYFSTGTIKGNRITLTTSTDLDSFTVGQIIIPRSLTYWSSTDDSQKPYYMTYVIVDSLIAPNIIVTDNIMFDTVLSSAKVAIADHFLPTANKKDDFLNTPCYTIHDVKIEGGKLKSNGQAWLMTSCYRMTIRDLKVEGAEALSGNMMVRWNVDGLDAICWKQVSEFSINSNNTRVVNLRATLTADTFLVASQAIVRFGENSFNNYYQFHVESGNSKLSGVSFDAAYGNVVDNSYLQGDSLTDYTIEFHNGNDSAIVNNNIVKNSIFKVGGGRVYIGYSKDGFSSATAKMTNNAVLNNEFYGRVSQNKIVDMAGINSRVIGNYFDSGNNMTVDTTRTFNAKVLNNIMINPYGGITLPNVFMDGNHYKNTEASLPDYADNAAAISAGLAIGTRYKTGDNVKIVH